MRPPITLICGMLAVLLAPYHTGSAADEAQTGAESGAAAAIAAAIEDPLRLQADRARDAGASPKPS